MGMGLGRQCQAGGNASVSPHFPFPGVAGSFGVELPSLGRDGWQLLCNATRAGLMPCTTPAAFLPATAALTGRCRAAKASMMMCLKQQDR